MTLVYLATNTINGNRYVGFTKRTIDRRRREHFRLAERGESRMLICRAIKKHGKDAFEFSVLEECPDVATGIEAEKRYISELNPEYNVSRGGIAPTELPWTDERRARHSIAMKAIWDNPTRRIKQTKALKGRKLSQERIDRMIGSENPSSRKSVVCLDDGKFFASAMIAAQYYGLHRSNMYGLLHNKYGKRNGVSLIYSETPLREDDRLSRLYIINKRYEKRNSLIGIARSKAVVCCTDGKEYPSVVAASKVYGLSLYVIRTICRGNKSRATKLSFRFAHE